MSKYTSLLRIDQQPTQSTYFASGSSNTADNSDVSTATENYQYKVAGGADAAMFTSFDEFGYNPNVILDNVSVSFNAKYDELVLETTASKADIKWTVENELSRCPNIRTLCLWNNWFTRIGASQDLTKVRPGIGYSTKARLNVSTDWTSGGYTPTTAINFPSSPAISGSADDRAYALGARYLQQRGYNIGVVPVVRFVDTSGTQETSWETWRGLISWPDLTTLNSWIAEYKTFVQHCLDLLLSYGVTPSVMYVGSEFRNLSTTAPSSQQQAWIQCLQDLSDYIATNSPTTKITYAANYDEYGTISDHFYLDPLWSYKNIHRVGIDYYVPLSLQHTNDPHELRAGLMSGELFDWYATGYTSTESALSTTSGQGKIGLTQNSMDTAYGSKPVPLFLVSAHYETKPSGVNAAASPLAGDWFVSSLILGNMSGPATPTKISTLPAQSTGMRMPPKQRDCWLALNGTSDYGSIAFPTYSTAPTTYTVEIDFRYSGGSSSYPRLLRSDVVDAFVDTGLLKFAIARSGGTDYSSGIAVTSGNDYLVSLAVSGTSAKVYSNGVLVETVTLGGAATMPASAGTWYLGTYSGSSDFLSGRIYYFKLEAPKASGKSYGGIFYFEEAYAGIRSSWVPNSKGWMATETGIASMNGSSVEPNIFPAVITGTGSLPDWYSDKPFWDDLRDKGLTVQDMLGPYGSNFAPDQYHQATALDVMVQGLYSLSAQSVVVYNFDTRPFDTMTALYNNGTTLYYMDGPKSRLNHSLNSKLAGGF